MDFYSRAGVFYNVLLTPAKYLIHDSRRQSFTALTVTLCLAISPVRDALLRGYQSFITRPVCCRPDCIEPLEGLVNRS